MALGQYRGVEPKSVPLLQFTIRDVRPEDDARLTYVIRTVMASFGVCGPGTAYGDPEVERMSAHYGGSGTGYRVLERDGEIVGGAGYGPLNGGEPGVCELRKMYLLPEVRGHGMGRRILETTLGAAKEAGYHTCYLETVPQMEVARRLYESLGFERLDRPMGATGHGACDVWYAKKL